MPQPTQDEIQRAEELLRTIPEYAALVDPANRGKMFRVGEASQLAKLTDYSVRNFAEKGFIHGAIRFPDGQWRIPYSSLVCFVAEQYRNSQQVG